MSKVKAPFILINDDTLKSNVSRELEVKIKSNEVLEKTADGLRVKVNDSATATDNLWSSTKVSNELAQKATQTYVDNAIAGLKWKAPILAFKTQVQLDALSPQAGERYIVTDSTNANKVAQYSGSAWVYTSPVDNWTVVCKSDDKAYTYDADTSAWVYKGGITQSENNIREEFTLSAQNITDKKVTLTYTPVNASYVNLNVVGGCAQDNGADYTVNGTTKELSWSGLGLDGLLASGDVLVVTYSKLG